MGQNVTLTASDNQKLGAYRADPAGTPKGAVVVIQEIFGVNHHIRAVTDNFAKAGYVAIAPAVFDRQKPGFECGRASLREKLRNEKSSWVSVLRPAQRVGRP